MNESPTSSAKDLAFYLWSLANDGQLRIGEQHSINASLPGGEAAVIVHFGDLGSYRITIGEESTDA